MPRSYESKSKRRSSLVSRLPIVAATIGAVGVEIVAASAADLAQKMIVAEFENTLRTGEPKDATEAEKLSAKDMEERGIELRAELVKTFDKRGAAGKLSYVNDVTACIEPYVSAGMTFEQSESVLRAAGFVVRPRPGSREEHDPHRSRDWYAVHAEMPDFPRRVLGRVDVYVTLYPESPGDYGNVKHVEAIIFVTIL